jgi:hypothetical protein
MQHFHTFSHKSHTQIFCNKILGKKKEIMNYVNEYSVTTSKIIN